MTDRAKSKWVKEILDHLHQDKRVYIAGCGSMNRGEAMDRSVFFGLYPELFPYEEKIVLLAEDPDQDPIKHQVKSFELKIILSFRTDVIITVVFV